MEATKQDRGEEEKSSDYVFHFFLLGLVFFLVSLLSYLLDLMHILGIKCLSTCSIETDIPT